MIRYAVVQWVIVFQVVSQLLGQESALSPEVALQTINVSDGLQVRTFAADPDIVSISNLDVDHRGRVWACECVNYRFNNGKRPKGDRILILEDTDGDGVSDKTTVFYQGRDIDTAMGLCVLGNKAIVSVAPDIILLEDTDGDDKADKKTVLLTSDASPQNDHSLHSFVFGPDGRFYGNFGNSGRRLKTANGSTIIDRLGNEIAEGRKPYHGGMVFRCDGAFSNFEVLGHNFRNNYEAAVDSFGSVWQSDNDDDGNEGVRLNYILAGGNYGYLDELTGERWPKPRIGAHPSRSKRHWHQNDPGVVPNVIEIGNGAPAGIAVCESVLLPGMSPGHVLVCDTVPHAIWGFPISVSGAGFDTLKLEILRSSDNNFRPVDVAIAPDGSLFVSDWYDPVVGGYKQDDIERGRVYWIAPAEHKYRCPTFDVDTPRGLVNMLRNPNSCARYLAWTALHEMGEGAEAALQELLVAEDPRMRARALWLLGQIPGKSDEYVRRAITDSDADVRIMGLRLADLVGHDILEVVGMLVDDRSARVRAECAIHLRHLDSPDAVQAWARLASQHDGQDRWYLEALGIGADGKWDDCLAAYLKLDAEIPEPAGNDIIWRSRGSATPDLLAEIVLRADESEDLSRYIRAFDFQTGDAKDDALLSIAYCEGIANEIALEAIYRVSPSRISSDAAARQRLVNLLKSNSLSRKGLLCIKQYQMRALYPRLVQLAVREDHDLRVDACVALLGLKQENHLKHVLLGEDASASSAMADVLVQSRHPNAVEMLVTFVQDDNKPLPSRQETARGLCRYQLGAEAILKLLDIEALPSEEIRQAIATNLLTNQHEDIRQRAEKFFSLSATKHSRVMPKLYELVNRTGDPATGKQVFAKQGKCATCHKVANEGKDVGPDLSNVGTKLSRTALFEAILYPSAAISHNFDNYQIETDSGQVFSGILVNQNEQEIQLRDAEGILRTWDRSEVEDFYRSKVSLMPANLHEEITEQELVDLVEYLSTLKMK